LRLSRIELSPMRIKTKCCRANPPVVAGPIASPLMLLHKDQAVRIGTNATPLACVFSGQIVALRPHQAGFTFGQIGTDAAPPACVYSGQIWPLRRIKRISPSVKSGLTPRSRRALTEAKSGPPRRIKRTSPSVKSGLTPRSRRALTQAKSGPPRRIKRSAPSATTISDRLGSCALDAVCAHAVTYPAEGHLEDYAPSRG
jgi:hypothetical protein